jgi:hypothetical protein
MILALSIFGNCYKKLSSYTVGQDVKNSTTIDAAMRASLRSFVATYSNAIFKTDSKLFEELMDKDGIYSITYFGDKRDRNVVLHLFKGEIRDDLVLANEDKVRSDVK